MCSFALPHIFIVSLLPEGVVVAKTSKRICSYVLIPVMSIKYLLKYVESLKLLYKGKDKSFWLSEPGPITPVIGFPHEREKKGQAPPTLGGMM